MLRPRNVTNVGYWHSMSRALQRALLILAAMAVYALHQDFWYWRQARPLVLGVLPIGLFYHVVYTLGLVLWMAAMVRLAWPSHLERDF